MTIHANHPDSCRYTILLDGEDISKTCRYADEEQSVAYCVILIQPPKRLMYALSHDLPAEWEVPVDCMIVVERQGRVEIIPRDY
jgi:hypothetical protein